MNISKKLLDDWHVVGDGENMRTGLGIATGILASLFVGAVCYANEITSATNFKETIRTNPSTGEPELFRGGKWVNPDSRLDQLMRSLHGIIDDLEIADNAEKPASERTRAQVRIVNSLESTGVGARAFEGPKFDKTIADPKLKKVMEMEWFVGQGTSMLREELRGKGGLGMNAWINCLHGWFVDNSKNDKIISEVLKRVKPASNALMDLSKKGAVPALAAMAGTYFLLSGTGKAEASTTVSSENVRPAQTTYDDSNFGVGASQ